MSVNSLFVQNARRHNSLVVLALGAFAVDMVVRRCDVEPPRPPRDTAPPRGPRPPREAEPPRESRPEPPCELEPPPDPEGLSPPGEVPDELSTGGSPEGSELAGLGLEFAREDAALTDLQPLDQQQQVNLTSSLEVQFRTSPDHIVIVIVREFSLVKTTHQVWLRQS